MVTKRSHILKQTCSWTLSIQLQLHLSICDFFLPPGIKGFKQTHLFFVHFSEYLLFFLLDNVITRIIFKRTGSASGCCLCLIFCQFHPGIAYKRVAYKKKRTFHYFNVFWQDSCFRTYAAWSRSFSFKDKMVSLIFFSIIFKGST